VIQPTRRACPFTNALKLDSLTELAVATSSRIARSVGVPIFPSAMSQGVGGGLVLASTNRNLPITLWVDCKNLNLTKTL
jgi:hypothetical protein